MFTGIIEAVSTIKTKHTGATGIRLDILLPDTFTDVARGDSISVNGVCLTVSALTHTMFSADIALPTADDTTLGACMSSERVNLERALQANGRFGGHIVQGHVDGIGTIKRVYQKEQNYFLQIQADVTIISYLIHKGSVAIDGISLTIQDVTETDFTVVVIPHTLEHTTVRDRKAGDTVNLEIDVLAKYVQKMLARGNVSSLTINDLKEQGF